MSLTDIMSAAGLSSWTELALILCFITFSAIVLWVFVVRRKPSYEHARHLPLEDNGNDPSQAVAKGGNSS
jgi:cbb3-type cytochrome oxidase subunit 3